MALAAIEGQVSDAQAYKLCQRTLILPKIERMIIDFRTNLRFLPGTVTHVAGISIILSYMRIYRTTIVVKHIFVVSDIRFNDIMRIPRDNRMQRYSSDPFSIFS